MATRMERGGWRRMAMASMARVGHGFDDVAADLMTHIGHRYSLVHVRSMLAYYPDLKLTGYEYGRTVCINAASLEANHAAREDSAAGSATSKPLSREGLMLAIIKIAQTYKIPAVVLKTEYGISITSLRKFMIARFGAAGSTVISELELLGVADAAGTVDPAAVVHRYISARLSSAEEILDPLSRIEFLGSIREDLEKILKVLSTGEAGVDQKSAEVESRIEAAHSAIQRRRTSESLERR